MQGVAGPLSSDLSNMSKKVVNSRVGRGTRLVKRVTGCLGTSHSYVPGLNMGGGKSGTYWDHSVTSEDGGDQCVQDPKASLCLALGSIHAWRIQYTYVCVEPFRHIRAHSYISLSHNCTARGGKP
jgi:hypothetical protein